MTTTVKTRCEVVDQILEWTNADGALNIHEGDLILWLGEFEVVSEIKLTGNGTIVHVAFEGRGGLRHAGPSDLVAVRRYVETTEE